MYGHILVVHSIDPQKLFASIPPDNEQQFWLVFFHGDDPALATRLAAFCAQRPGLFFDFRENRGLARSWNDVIIEGQQRGIMDFLLLNDDLYFYEGCYNEFVSECRNLLSADENVGMITPLGMESGASPHSGQIHPQMFACSLITRHALSKIGYFDENFWPAYFEDSDYSVRMRRAGLRQSIIQRVMVEHERSSTLRASEKLRRKHSDEFTNNREYFSKKWGNYQDPANLFDHPFGNPDISVFMSKEDRGAYRELRFPQSTVSDTLLSSG